LSFGLLHLAVGASISLPDYCTNHDVKVNKKMSPAKKSVHADS